MAPDDLLDEDRFGEADILDRLAGFGAGQEADEVAGMARRHRHADLAILLHAADTRPVSGARIDDDEGPPGRIDCGAFCGTIRAST